MLRSNSTILLLVSLFFTSCHLMVTDNKQIFGHWSGIEWLSEGSPSSYDPEDASFTFNEDGDYTFQYGSNIEKGKYTFNNNQLFTTPEGGIRMMVKVIRMENDTLVFDMNRGGVAERLTLIRK